MHEPVVFSLPDVRRVFDRASATYDAFAGVQTEIRTRLIERLDYVRVTPRVILDLGTGTGHTARLLKRRYPQAQVLALDISTRMLAQAKSQSRWRHRFARICADIFRLPCKDRCVDLIVSNLTLHWCQPPDRVFAEIARVATPGALFMFTTLGPDTLRQLRTAWETVGETDRVHPFIDMHDLGDALMRARFAEPVMDVERLSVTYPSFDKFANELRATGGINRQSSRPRHLTGQQRFAALRAAMNAQQLDGKIALTLEVVYGHAWSPTTPTRTSASPGEVRVPLTDLKRQR